MVSTTYRPSLLVHRIRTSSPQVRLAVESDRLARYSSLSAVVISAVESAKGRAAACR
jgi:hypothetical protein